MKLITALLACLITNGALAGTSYSLPDPVVKVTPNASGTTTIVTVGKKAYRGPSAFYYVHHCANRDTPYYHCIVIHEQHVTLTATSGAIAIVWLTVQSASTLIRSGHNYWRHTDTVLAGGLTVR